MLFRSRLSMTLPSGGGGRPTLGSRGRARPTSWGEGQPTLEGWGEGVDGPPREWVGGSGPSQGVRWEGPPLYFWEVAHLACKWDTIYSTPLPLPIISTLLPWAPPWAPLEALQVPDPGPLSNSAKPWALVQRPRASGPGPRPLSNGPGPGSLYHCPRPRTLVQQSPALGPCRMVPGPGPESHGLGP